ncbi:hypothetical protein VTO73DRAFT_3985 [Trametes versicolor]
MQAETEHLNGADSQSDEDEKPLHEVTSEKRQAKGKGLRTGDRKTYVEDSDDEDYFRRLDEGQVVVWASISAGGDGDGSLCFPVVVLNLTASSASFSHDTESPRAETQGGPGAAVETARGRIRDSGRVVEAGWWTMVWRAGHAGERGDVARSDSTTARRDRTAGAGFHPGDLDAVQGLRGPLE